MKTLRLVLFLAIGVGYVLYSMSHPEHTWLARLVAAGAMIAIYLLTRLIAGKEAASTSPLAADPTPSLSLSERALQDQSKTSDS